MEIKILGVGCPRCHEVEKRVVDALAELDIAANVEKITDIKRFVSFGILATPGLVIDGEVMAAGRIPTKDEIKKWLVAATPATAG